MRFQPIIESVIRSLDEHSSIFDLRPEARTYYHGTSDAIDVGDRLLPPDMTGMISEVGRKRNTHRVFFTADIKSAKIYAGRAVRQFGGRPVVYEIAPVGEIEVLNHQAGTSVLAADWAYIKRKVQV